MKSMSMSSNARRIVVASCFATLVQTATAQGFVSRAAACVEPDADAAADHNASFDPDRASHGHAASRACPDDRPAAAHA
jgi:hypothetical protein